MRREEFRERICSRTHDPAFVGVRKAAQPLQFHVRHSRMQRNSLNLRINLAALQGTFFRRLQHQLDVTKVLQVGCDLVTAEQVGEQLEFGAFSPASGAQLKHEDAKVEAQDWLLRGFLRDAIEGTGLFLDECLQVCSVMQALAKGSAKGAELQHIFHSLSRANHRLHLPQKLAKLRQDFGVDTRFNENVLSLNRARACVVHRLGKVSALDVDETGALEITFQHARFVARGERTGQELILDRPGLLVTEDSVLEVRFVESRRRFQPGEHVRLQAHELYDTIITLWRFGIAIAQAVETYGRSVGLQFPSPSSEG